MRVLAFGGGGGDAGAAARSAAVGSKRGGGWGLVTAHHNLLSLLFVADSLLANVWFQPNELSAIAGRRQLRLLKRTLPLLSNLEGSFSIAVPPSKRQHSKMHDAQPNARVQWNRPSPPPMTVAVACF